MWASLAQEDLMDGSKKSVPEAEYQAILTAIERLDWIRPLLKDMGISTDGITIFSDNTIAMERADKEKLAILNNVTIKHIPGEEQPADALSKVVPYDTKKLVYLYFGLRNVIAEICEACGQEMPEIYHVHKKKNDN